MSSTITRQFKHTLRVNDVSADAIWAVWKDVENWPQWNLGLEECRLNGKFAEGQTFSLLPKGEISGSNPFVTTLTRVEENVVFDDRTPVPWGVVNGSHRIQEVDGELEISHEINAEVNADKIDFFESVIAKKWSVGLPEALKNVVALARTKIPA